MCPNEVNDTGVYLEFDGGVGYLYTPPVEGLMSGDELGEILTVEPYASNPEMLAHYILGGRSPDKEAQQMAQALPNHYTFPEENNWDDFSIQQVEQLKRHKIIIWYGHGGYIDRVGSLLRMPCAPTTRSSPMGRWSWGAMPSSSPPSISTSI